MVRTHTCGTSMKIPTISMKWMAKKYVNKRGLLAGCRIFLCLNDCFLKGAFKGQILADVDLDAENGIYPVAWAVVEVENTDSWTWGATNQLSQC
ncbi:hypothetical protein LIER_14907 [Lithospermum erythrorhizon]|uniref:Uncharacterized protein n=1 Tax=Lithospermum erythrorhizon TaxID=34254 RepID=A0AAV3Q2F1_LITER